jgi:O-antigen/teichoic acid export membrane protein
MIKKISFHVIIYGFLNVLKSLVPFLLLPILTEHLSLKEYGDLSIIETLILFVMPFILLNVHGAINVEFFKKDKETFKKYFINAVMISFFAYVIVSIILFFFENQIHKFTKLSPIWIELISTFVIIRALPMIGYSFFQASKNIKYYAFTSILQVLIDFSLSLLLVLFFHMGLIGRLSGIFCSFLTVTVILMYIFFKWGFFKTFTLKFTKEILLFGIPLIPHAIGGVTLALSDRLFISSFYNSSYVGLYTVAYQIGALMLLVGRSVNQAWTPFFFELLKNNKKQKAFKIIIYFHLIFIVIFMFFLFTKDLFYLIFINEKFYSSKEYFFPILIGFLFQSLYLLITNYFFYYEKTKVIGLITIFGAVINIVLNYFLIIKFGVSGVAYATAITWFIYYLFILLGIYFEENKC